MNKKKVAVLLRGLNFGGIPNVILNYYRQISNDVQIDFIVQNKRESHNKKYLEEVENNGSNVYFVTDVNKNMLRYSREIKKILKINNYDVVHDNNKYFAFLSLLPAKKLNIPIRVCHVHNTVMANEKSLLHRFFIIIASYLTKKYATRLVACSVEAGKSMFGTASFNILNNAIDVKKFCFSKDERISIRKELNLENSFVIVMVGRMDVLKNHAFAFELFRQVIDIKPNAKLLVIGVERDKMLTELKNQFFAYSKKVQDNIIFLGKRDDVYRLLNAADVFIFPSIHEGFGMSVIEAQANGLPCLVSNTVPYEVKITDLVTFLSIDHYNEWITILASLSCRGDAKDYTEELKAGDFDISTVSKKLLHTWDILGGH